MHVIYTKGGGLDKNIMVIFFTRCKDCDVWNIVSEWVVLDWKQFNRNACNLCLKKQASECLNDEDEGIAYAL